MASLSLELYSGLASLDFTARAISLPMRVKVLAMPAQRLNFLSLRNSNARPITVEYFGCSRQNNLPDTDDADDNICHSKAPQN
jgi:hypothetical protein